MCCLSNCILEIGNEDSQLKFKLLFLISAWENLALVEKGDGARPKVD